MNGWKTYAGALVMAIGAALTYLGYDEVAKSILALGGAVGLVGIGHKAEKIRRGLKFLPLLILLPALMFGMAHAAHQDGFIVNLKTDGEFVKELSGVATMQFNSEYSILLKNNNDRRCSARVFIDGARVSPKGDFVIEPNGELDLTRFVADLQEGKRFKFVPIDHPEVDDPTRSENGVVRVEFRLEKEEPDIEWYDLGTITTDDEFKGNDLYFDNTLSDTDIDVSDMSALTSGTYVSDTSAGATVGGSMSMQAFREVHYEFEDAAVVLKLKIEGV